jgi:hypothetical protein
MYYNLWSGTGMMNVGADGAETHSGPSFSSISTMRIASNGDRTLFCFYGN